jgi:HlyD family secretion protein
LAKSKLVEPNVAPLGPKAMSPPPSHVAQANLERTRLRAPFAGVIAEITGELNEYTTPSPPGIPTPPAIDLIDNNCFYVSAPIDEIDAAAIKVGMPARITLDAFGERAFSGTVRRVAAYVLDLARQARTVSVEAEFADRGEYERLLAGYSADVEVILKVHANTLYIPTESIIGRNQVLILNRGTGRLERRAIDTGISNWDRTEIRSGLASGEQVVVSLDREGVRAGALAAPAH